MDNIKSCYMCKSNDLTYKEQESIFEPIENKYIKKDVLQCNECECVHYYEGSQLAFQYSRTVGEPVRVNHLKSDYETALLKQQADKAKEDIIINA